MSQVLPQAQVASPHLLSPLSEHFSIEVATSKKEKDKIYRLRYQIYVEEMAKRLSNADHRRRLLVDDMDGNAILFYVRDGSKIIGTLRLHIGEKHVLPPELVEVFAMDDFINTCPQNTPNPKFSFISKGMITPEYRSSQVFNALITKFFEASRREGVVFGFVGCSPYLVPVYERHGARRYKSAFFVPDYGCMVPLVYVFDDIDHLSRIGSPFRHVAASWPTSPEAAAWFASAFPQAATYINRRLTDKPALWQLLTAKLGQAPENAIGVFRGLSLDEAMICADVGHIYFADRGDTIVYPFDMSHEVFVVLSGTVTVRKQLANRRQTMAYLSPGQTFGEKAFATHSRYNKTVTAQTDVELLILPKHGLERLQLQHPAVAAKFLRNLGVRASRKYA